MQVVLTPEHLSPLPLRTLRLVFIQEFFFSFFDKTQQLFVYPSAHHDDVRTTYFSTAMPTSTSISTTSASRGYHLHVVFISFYSNHTVHTITTLQLHMGEGGGLVRRILFSAYSPVSPFVILTLWLWGNVTVYLVGYIFCIIDCYICQDIFGRIYIIYSKLPYVSGGALPSKLLYSIYTTRKIQCNTTNNYTKSILFTFWN
jgi:hypothetical protein